MKNYKVIMMMLFFANYCLAQEDAKSSNKKMSSSVYLAYNSSVIYPGLRAGLQLPVKRVYVEKFNKNGVQKNFTKDRFLTVNFGWYDHQNFHDNLYFTAGYTFRRTKSSGFFTEFSPEIGYSRTFLGGVTYQVDDNGTVSKSNDLGYSHGIMSVGGGIGYDFSVKKSKPILLYYKVNLLTMYPYNSTFYMRPAMEIGIVYKFSNFLKFNTRIKHIKK